MGGGLAGDPVPEVEPDETMATATVLPFGPAGDAVNVSGTAPGTDDRDFFRFTGSAGDRLMATVVHQRNPGGSGRFYIELCDAAGYLVHRSGTGVFEGDPYLDYVLPASGTWYILVRMDIAGEGTQDYERIMALE